MVAATGLECMAAEDTKVPEQAQKNAVGLPSLDEIKRSIPAECFEKSLPRSLFYFVLDVAILAVMYLIVPNVEAKLGYFGLIVWYYLMGMFMFALFVVGHDCGHGSFSNYPIVNDVIGHLAHAPLQVPFWPWQKSHRQHHQYTSHLHKDMGHPWFTQPEFLEQNWITQVFLTTPIYGFVSWNLVYNVLGYPDGSHFWPFSKLFTTTEDRVKCTVSGVACLVAGYIAYAICSYDPFTMVKYYVIPLVFHALWLTMVTYLQHRHEEIEVFEPTEWTFVMGQSQTIDREYGFGIDQAIHHITDGHVAHHLFFTRIPHYHLMAATKAVQKVLGQVPGAYKSERTYGTLMEFFRLLPRLDYLLSKRAGVHKFRSSQDFQPKVQ